MTRIPLTDSLKSLLLQAIKNEDFCPVLSDYQFDDDFLYVPKGRYDTMIALHRQEVSKQAV